MRLPILVISLIVSYYIIGCSPNAEVLNKPPRNDIDKYRVTVESKLLTESEKEYKIEIIVKNQTEDAFFLRVFS
ncbi:hypothetical protein N752_27795 [Desulforamulus aquiferis]|nr:hypothetical protein [Desulforamulus aquiferis]RYD01930.1 hypothetical protein N752_27795 [Desulforamulus aquiferis]